MLNRCCCERPKIQVFVIYHYYLSFFSCGGHFSKSLLYEIFCRNVNSVAQIASEIWGLEGPELISNRYCPEKLKIKVFVLFQYFLQIAVVYIF